MCLNSHRPSLCFQAGGALSLSLVQTAQRVNLAATRLRGQGERLRKKREIREEGRRERKRKSVSSVAQWFLVRDRGFLAYSVFWDFEAGQ